MKWVGNGSEKRICNRKEPGCCAHLGSRVKAHECRGMPAANAPLFKASKRQTGSRVIRRTSAAARESAVGCPMYLAGALRPGWGSGWLLGMVREYHALEKGNSSNLDRLFARKFLQLIQNTGIIITKYTRK